MVPKSALFPLLFLIRPFCMVLVSGLSQSHLPCLQQKLFSDPNPWTAKNRNVFSACLSPTACYTVLFYCNILTEPNWSQQTRWTLLEHSIIIPKWTAISFASRSLRLFWFLIHFRLSVLPFEVFFLTVCSKPPVNPADCSGTDLTGTTDWLTDSLRGSQDQQCLINCHRNCYRCYPFLRQTIVLKCHKVTGHLFSVNKA